MRLLKLTESFDSEGRFETPHGFADVVPYDGGVAIYEFTSAGLRHGNGRRLLIDLRSEFGSHVHVVDPGESGSDSRKFWDQMCREGLVQSMEDSEGSSLLTESDAVTKPPALKELMSGVSLGKDDDGFYVYTHRARSGSYATPEKIPKSRIKFIASTG